LAFDPLKIRISGLATNEYKGLLFTCNNGPAEEEILSKYGGNFWYHRNRVATLNLYMKKELQEKITAINIWIGPKHYRLDKGNFSKYWKGPLHNQHRVYYRLVSKEILKKSLIPQYNMNVNYGGDCKYLWALLGSICKFLLLILLLIVLLKGLGDEKVRSVVLEDNFGGEKHDRNMWLIWLFGGLLFLIGQLWLTQWMQPYYFTKDDNYAQFLPVIIQGCRSLLIDHVLPTINPFQKMGCPTMGVGTYALTYPITYIAYILSKLFTGKEYATIEVFCIIHLLLGYFASFKLLEKLHLRPSICATGSLSFVLAGFNFIMGRAWYYMTPTILWFPLLILSLLMLQEAKHKWRWAIINGLIIGAYYHSGNVQMWVYAMMFYIISALIFVLTNKIAKQKLIWITTGGLFGLSLTLPMLFAQLSLTRNLPRYPFGNGTFEGLLSMIIPYPLKAPDPNYFGFSTFREYTGQFYYSGTLFILAGFLAIVWLVINVNKMKTLYTIIRNHSFLLVGFIALLCSLGNHGILWAIMTNLPFFDKLTNPLKFLPFANIFLIASGAVLVERYLALKKDRKYLEQFMAFSVLILLTYNCILCKSIVYDYGNKSYPKLNREIASVLNTENRQFRIFTISPWRSQLKQYTSALDQNFATIYGFYSLNGYEPLVKDVECSNEAFRKYGVKWIIVFKEPNSLFPSKYNSESIGTFARQVKESRQFFLYQVMDYDPICFIANDKKHVLPIKFRGNGADIDTSSIKNASVVVVNMFKRTGMIAKADERVLKINNDKYGRVMVRLPQKTRRLRIRYYPSWNMGFKLSIIMMFLGVGLLAVPYPFFTKMWTLLHAPIGMKK
jgi:hypothetical protein